MLPLPSMPSLTQLPQLSLLYRYKSLQNMLTPHHLTFHYFQHTAICFCLKPFLIAKSPLNPYLFLLLWLPRFITHCSLPFLCWILFSYLPLKGRTSPGFAVCKLSPRNLTCEHETKYHYHFLKISKFCASPNICN